MRTLSRELRDFYGYWLLPMLAVVLPWKWCWKLYQHAANNHLLYREESEAMCKGLQQLQPETDTTDWPKRFRLAWLLEQADLFLFHFCPRRHLQRQWIQPDGHWPEQKPFIALFFNFGFGLLVLEDIRRTGLHPSLVYAPAPKEKPAGMSYSRYFYMRLRQKAMQKACELQAIPTGGAWNKIQQAIQEKRTVVVVTDAPSTEQNRTIPVELFGHQGRWRRGVPEMVVNSGLPAVTFRIRIHWDTGQRQCVISEPLPTDSVETLVHALTSIFHQGMEEHPETWLYWTALEVFLPQLAEKQA